MTITFDSTEKPYLQTFPWDQTSSTSECRKEPLESIFKTSSETAAATLDDDMQTFVDDTCSHKKEQYGQKKKEMIQQKTLIFIT